MTELTESDFNILHAETRIPGYPVESLYAYSRALIAKAQELGGQNQPWQHVQRQTTYLTLDVARVQTSRPIKEDDLVMVYRADSDDSLWVRPVSEFYDGRFVRLRK